MGGSKKQTVGYWYKLLYHAGLCKGPIDAFLEFRGGDKIAWQGEQTASGTISIDKPKLWGGEKDQGGIVSDVDVLFGEATQVPNGYLLANLGDQVPAWRGLATLVFKGGRYGAINPYPQKASYKIRKIKQGWDTSCWYPEKAAIVIPRNALLPAGQVTLQWWQNCFYQPPSNDLAAMGISFYDTAGVQIGATTWAPMIDSYPWTQRTLVVDIPANADSMRIWQAFQVADMPNANSVDAYIDDISASINGVAVPIINPGAETGDTTGWTQGTGAVDATYGGHSGLWMFIGTSPSSINYAYQGATVFNSLAMNPAHVLYYARTNSDMGREPTANLNAASLTAAADTLHAEGFGICTTRDPAQESVEEFEQRITKLIDGSFSRDPITGLWHLDLSRGDYVLGDLPILTDDDILEFRELPSTLDNAINSVSVTYFDPERKEAITTPPVQARALIQDFGTIHQTIEYPEIPTADLAARVALRELRATATPTRAFDLVCTRTPFAWRPNTYFRLQAPKRGIADMVCIVGEKESGSLKSGAIKLKAAQDIYSMPATAFVDIEPGVDTGPVQTPVAITLQSAWDAPYIELIGALSRADLDLLPVGAGYLQVVAADPAVSTSYTLTVDAGAGYADVAAGDWCPTGTLSAAASRTTTAVTVAGGMRLDEVLVGSAALLGSEIVRIDAINPTTGALTIARGCADTVPQEHGAGARFWFYQGNDAIDPTEYTAGESINIKLLTNTGSQQLDPAAATPMAVTFVSRAWRPYPPANVKVAGADWPASITGSFSVTWAHRDRVLQSDQLVDTSLASVGPPDNQRYGLRFRRTDTSAVLVERADIGPPTATVTLTYTGDVSMELWTIDDSNVSWQSHLYTFAYTPPVSPTDTITATPYTPVYGGTIIDAGDLDA